MHLSQVRQELRCTSPLARAQSDGILVMTSTVDFTIFLKVSAHILPIQPGSFLSLMEQRGSERMSNLPWITQSQASDSRSPKRKETCSLVNSILLILSDSPVRKSPRPRWDPTTTPDQLSQQLLHLSTPHSCSPRRAPTGLV